MIASHCRINKQPGKASAFLTEYSLENGIYMKINYFADHTHALIDLPTRYSIEEVIKFFKGGSVFIERYGFEWPTERNH